MIESASPQLHTTSLSDVGCVRSRNEDCCGEFSNEQGFYLLVVADGMGGHQGGVTAGRMAVDVLGKCLHRGVGDPTAFLRDAFQQANARIHGTAAEISDLRGMGTTGVALLIDPSGPAVVAHVGDSRAYRSRGGQMQAITVDHSWVQSEVQQDRLTPGEAAMHVKRNVLLRSIGVEPEVEVDVVKLDVEPGDRFLLCSDGLWGEVDDGRISAVLREQSADRAARTLVDLARRSGGGDNVTVQLAYLEAGATESATQRTEVQGSVTLAGRYAPSPSREARERRIVSAAAAVGGLLLLSLLWYFVSGGNP